MSSTNRGGDRHVSDYYVTPKACIETFMSAWLQDLVSEFHDDPRSVGARPDRARWLDPCAGGDPKHPSMSYPKVLTKLFEPEVGTIDIRDDSSAERIEDYLRAEITPDYYDVIITNPPFAIAKEVIEKALRDVAPNGYVVMLLRLNFFGGELRRAFWEKQLPTWAYVHHRRMSFTDDKKTDSIEYMHAVWQRDANPHFTMLAVI